MANCRGGDDGGEAVVGGGEAKIACEREVAQDKHGGEGWLNFAWVVVIQGERDRVVDMICSVARGVFFFF
ncbi:hypothetical protein F2Q68_00008052 [Brassica cretica]|uniref:Uncharacterized protein n=1 Tax=Brassica cretica TaxID=69181 RepID=A0A8S9KRR5_BRACR|nr:hypothetical protein F2Q68_00008052 [Brassica cretica]